jgi:hypothetical protein
MPGDDDDDDDWENSEAKRQLDAGRDKDMVLSWKRRLQQAKALGFDVDDPAIIQQLLVAHNKAAPADGSSNSAAGAAAGAGFDQAFAASASATGVSSVGKANTAAALQQRGAELRSERSKGNKGAGRDGKSEGGSSGLFGGAGHAKKKSKKDSEGGEKGKDDKSTKGKDDGKAAAAVLGVFVLVSLGGLRVLWHQDIAAPRGEYEVLDRSLPKPASVSGGKVQLSKMKPQLIPGLTSTYPEPPGVPQPLGNELVYQFFSMASSRRSRLASLLCLAALGSCPALTGSAVGGETTESSIRSQLRKPHLERMGHRSCWRCCHTAPINSSTAPAHSNARYASRARLLPSC